MHVQVSVDKYDQDVLCMCVNNSEHIVSKLTKSKDMDLAWWELLDIRTIQC